MFDPNENRFGDPEDQFTRPPRRPASPMAMAAISCAIIGILTVFTVYGSLLFGSLAVIFAVLSKGEKDNYERPAKYALRVGVIAIVIGAVISVISIFMVIYEFGSLENFYLEYLQMLNSDTIVM